MTIRKNVRIFLIAMLVLTTLPEMAKIEILAQQEITPAWTYEGEGRFSIVAISADGNYLGTGTKNTNKFYLFRGNLLLWDFPVGSTHSVSMSSDGKYIAVGAEGTFYLFERESSSPLLEYSIGYETSLVAISSDGNYSIIGATQGTYLRDAESKLYLFQREHPTPTWTKTLPGILESLSISSNGNFIVATTSLPGIMYVFAREQDAPQWNYSFGNLSGAAKISNDGNYIVATGGDKVFADNPTRERRVFQFSRQNSFPVYQKSIPELPPPSGLSISSNGSIFVVSYTNRSELILFNKNVQPYGPNSIRTASLPAHRVSMTMSSDGRYVFVGTAESVLFYEYCNNRLDLKKQYLTSNATISDLASSSDGRYVVAVGYGGPLNSEHSLILFFDIFGETRNTTDPWGQWSPLIVSVAIFITVVSGFVFYRRRKASKNSSHHSVETVSPMRQKTSALKRKAK